MNNRKIWIHDRRATKSKQITNISERFQLLHTCTRGEFCTQTGGGERARRGGSRSYRLTHRQPRCHHVRLKKTKVCVSNVEYTLTPLPGVEICDHQNPLINLAHYIYISLCIKVCMHQPPSWQAIRSRRSFPPDLFRSSLSMCVNLKYVYVHPCFSECAPRCSAALATKRRKDPVLF